MHVNEIIFDIIDLVVHYLFWFLKRMRRLFFRHYKNGA